MAGFPCRNFPKLGREAERVVNLPIYPYGYFTRLYCLEFVGAVPDLVTRRAMYLAALRRGADPRAGSIRVLRDACKNGWPDVAELALAGGARHPPITGEEIRNRMSDTLIVACDCAHADVVSMLFAPGRLTAADARSAYVLAKAAAGGDVETFKRLVDAGATVADIRAARLFGNVCCNGDEPLVAYLLSIGLGLEDIEHDDWSALAWACFNKHAGVVALLVACEGYAERKPKMVDVSEAARTIYSAEIGVASRPQADQHEVDLLLACKTCDGPGLAKGLAQELDPADKEILMGLAFAEACEAGWLEGMAKIFAHGGAELVTFRGLTPLQRACQGGKVDAIRYLFAKKLVTVEHVRRNNYYEVGLACQNGGVPALKAFVEAGLNADDVRACGGLAMEWAVDANNAAAIQWLGTMGASKADAISRDLLHKACKNNHLMTVAAIIGLGYTAADINCSQALTYICYKGYRATLQMMLGRFTPDDVAKYCGTYPMQAACAHGHVALVELMIEAGFGVDMLRAPDNIYLYTACMRGRVGVARLLFSRGLTYADAVRDNMTEEARVGGYAIQSPRAVAVNNRHAAVVELIDSLPRPAVEANAIDMTD